MTGVFGITPTQSYTATRYSSIPSVNSKRTLKSDIESSSLEKIIKKVKNEQTNDQEDDQIFQDDVTTNPSEFAFASSPEDSIKLLGNDENSAVEEKTPKRKRYGNWLREIVNHVCKLLKLRLLSLKSLSKVLNDNSDYHSNHSEHLNDINSFPLSLPNLSSDVFETFKYDRRADSEAFTAFLEGFGKIKRNTYKMTEEYIGMKPIFGERLVKEILEFIPETDQISTNSQYLNWIRASTRMKKATKESLLDLQVRVALIRPLKKFYKSLCETNQRAINHHQMDAINGRSQTESKLLNEIKDYKSNLNLIEDEGGGRDLPVHRNLREGQIQGFRMIKTETPLKNDTKGREFAKSLTPEIEERNAFLSKKEEESTNSREFDTGALYKAPYNGFSYSKVNENLNKCSLLFNLLLKQQVERLVQNQQQQTGLFSTHKSFGSDEGQQELMKKLLGKLIEESRMNAYGH